MEKTLNKDHILIQIIYYATTALTYAFGTYTMLSRGVDSRTIGILIAVADLLALLLQVVMSNILDNSNKINTVQMSLIVSSILLVVYIINFALNVPSLILCINYVIYQSFLAMYMSLYNQLSQTFTNAGFNVDFGMARAFGSLSYGVICFLYGVISEKFGYRTITVSLIAFQILMIIALVKTNKDFNVPSYELNKSKQENISYKQFFSRHKWFILTCIGFGAIMCGYNATESFMLMIVEDCGGSNLDSGIIQGLKAILEVPVIYFFYKVEEKISIKNIFLISGISFVIKAATMYFAKSTLPLYISQIFQITSFGFILPAMVSYTNKIMLDKELARGHGLQSIIQTVFNMMLNAVSGGLIVSQGVKPFCLLATLVTIVGTFIIYISIKPNKNTQ